MFGLIRSHHVKFNSKQALPNLVFELLTAQCHSITSNAKNIFFINLDLSIESFYKPRPLFIFNLVVGPDASLSSRQPPFSCQVHQMPLSACGSYFTKLAPEIFPED